MGFLGYSRPDGSAGIRNHVAVMSTVSYANGVVKAVAREVAGVKAIAHTEGDARSPKDLEVTARTLVGLGRNPNVAAVVVVGLGTEWHGAHEIAEAIAETGKPVEALVIQDHGGSRKTTANAMHAARLLAEEARAIERREVGWDQLTVAMECGGSDALSGITANPSIGCFADWLVEKGGSVIISEITEMIGTEEILGRRAADERVEQQIKDVLDKQKRLAATELGPFASGSTISPGNVAGGITSIQEKSLGCIAKGGTSTIQGVLDYAAAPSRKGLHIMDTPGSDIFSITGMVAGGAQLVIFSTGRGSPAGFPIAPVIKVSTNNAIWEDLNDDMDVNAGRIVNGARVSDVGQELGEYVKEIIEGKATKAEANLYDLLSIHAAGPAVRRSTAR